MTKTSLRLLAVCATFALAGANAQPVSPSNPPVAAADDALFVALGGQPGIDAIAADFVPRLAADPRTSECIRKTKQPHFRQMLSEQFCQVSGGGCVYTGKPIAEARRDMDIAKADFNAVVEVLQASMDAGNVPFATQKRLLARLAPMHRRIVHGGSLRRSRTFRRAPARAGTRDARARAPASPATGASSRR